MEMGSIDVVVVVSIGSHFDNRGNLRVDSGIAFAAVVADRSPFFVSRDAVSSAWLVDCMFDCGMLPDVNNEPIDHVVDNSSHFVGRSRDNTPHLSDSVIVRLKSTVAFSLVICETCI